MGSSERERAPGAREIDRHGPGKRPDALLLISRYGPVILQIPLFASTAVVLPCTRAPWMKVEFLQFSPDLHETMEMRIALDTIRQWDVYPRLAERGEEAATKSGGHTTNRAAYDLQRGIKRIQAGSFPSNCRNFCEMLK
jgi:hypothetical protein